MEDRNVFWKRRPGESSVFNIRQTHLILQGSQTGQATGNVNIPKRSFHLFKRAGFMQGSCVAKADLRKFTLTPSMELDRWEGGAGPAASNHFPSPMAFLNPPVKAPRPTVSPAGVHIGLGLPTSTPQSPSSGARASCMPLLSINFPSSSSRGRSQERGAQDTTTWLHAPLPLSRCPPTLGPKRRSALLFFPQLLLPCKSMLLPLKEISPKSHS